MFVFRAFLLGVLTLHTVSALCGEDEKNYLLQYGFLDRTKDNTDEDVRGAILTLQQFYSDYGLNVTGDCDEDTISLMKQPRCGCEDVPKKETRMIPAENENGPQEYNIGNTKWTKKVLTWKVIKYPTRNNHLGNDKVDDAMARGLKIWEDQTNLRFEKTASNNADIKISFEVRRHTSRPPFYDFDGRSGVLAHAFFPQSGIVHFDDDEEFTLGNNEGTELYIVAAHEFGHTLGISHSNDKTALMAPFYRYADNLKLGQDDINAVQALYGRKTNTVPDRVTPRPTPPPPTTTPRGKILPSQCDMVIDASFRIGSTTYVFTTERSGGWRRTYVYKVHDSTGLDIQSGTLVRDMFLSRSSSRRRVYPYHVDAATYMPNINKVFLISGTRVYKYSIDNTQRDKFYIDSQDNYPRWFKVKDIPERPRAAVAMQFGRYYLFLYSESMMWIWNVENDLYRVSAWAYPIRMFGHLMPHNIDSAFDAGNNKVNFVRGERVYEFDLTRRRVVSQDSIQNVKTKFFKGPCM